ncbi:hypothetical protein DL93DRAFT_1998605 [Clavulina sp. PMI_390]|nr:hypothetical protein DL93DRAFT_1116862 [Clavulina sp. PMI_390]KAF8307635.1 hypothetical protein DL93DRAFT_1998605 [Clavulina sp. PMI_390]
MPVTIQHLFPELLVSIFVFLDLLPKKLGSLALVCRRWNEIVIDSSLLWRNIWLSIDGPKSTLAASPIPFVELCFIRSKMAKVVFTLSLRRMPKDHELIPPVRQLIIKYAPRIHTIDLRELFGYHSLLPLSFDFSALDTAQIFWISASNEDPDYIFALPVRLRSLQLRVEPPRPLGTRNIFRPLYNVDPTYLQTLTVFKLIRLSSPTSLGTPASGTSSFQNPRQYTSHPIRHQ